MSRPLQTVEIEGFGPVTFTPLGKVAMERIHESARRHGVRGYGSDELKLREMTSDQVQRLREDALLVSGCVVEPKLNEADFKGREQLMVEIAKAIREASWSEGT